MAMDKRAVSERAVRSAVLQLECTKGHMRWSVNDVARASKVSRSLVYYYFGKTKREIFFNSLSAVVDDFYGLSDDGVKRGLYESVLKTCQTYKSNPHYAVFFQKWRHKPSEVQDILLRAETRFEEKLASAFTRATPAQVKGLHALFHGLATAPYLDETSIQAAFHLINIAGLRAPRR